MYSPLKFTCLLAASVAADWTTQTWDAIIVGAGPAGIISKFVVVLLKLRNMADLS